MLWHFGRPARADKKVDVAPRACAARSAPQRVEVSKRQKPVPGAWGCRERELILATTVTVSSSMGTVA